MSNAVLYVITVLIWGSTWFAIEFQLGVVEPEVSIVYRYGGASILLFGWAWLKGLPLRFDLRAHGWFVVLGLFLFCLNYIMAYRAQIYITSAMSAIAFSTIVWMNILLARVMFGVRPGGRVLVGAAIGILGIVVLFAPRVGQLSWSDEVLFGSCSRFPVRLLLHSATWLRRNRKSYICRLFSPTPGECSMVRCSRAACV